MLHSHSNSHLIRALALTITSLLGVCSAGAWQLATNLTLKADLTLKESYDNNVYIQDKEPDPTVPNAVPARKSSFVTALTPKLNLDYGVCSGFNVSLSYAPDIVFYHDARSEDYFAHRASLSLNGKTETVSWEQVNAFTYIDGNHLGPTFGRPQDVPAIGGIPLRDRRDALIYRGGFKLIYTTDQFFLRPVASAYIHDFKTDQRASPAGGVYENYIDRQDVNGGLDIGYRVAEKTHLVLGYRYGRQDQYDLFNATPVNSRFDSAYHRALLGIEGTPANWLKLAVLGGPDIRSWADGTPPGFDRNEMLYWIDASVTLLPTEQDSIVLLNRRYEQPAFSSHSVYEDITYSVAWKHKFDDHWVASAGFQLYIGDWQAPVNREDWIYTPNVGLSYSHDKHLSAELAYSYDWVENQVSTSAAGAAYAEGREYTRHIVSLGAKYAF